MSYTDQDFENDCWDWFRDVTEKYKNIPNIIIELTYGNGDTDILTGWNAVEFEDPSPYTPKQIDFFRHCVEIYRKNPIEW